MTKSTYIKHNKHFFSYSAKFCYSDSHGGSKVKNYQVLQIIRQYLYWPKFLQIIFCSCSYTWAVQLIIEIFHLDISFIRVLLCVSRVFRVEEVDGVGESGSGDTTTVDVQKHLGAFLNMSLRSACFLDEVFFWWKSKLPVLGLLFWSARLSGYPNYWTSD